MSKDIFSNINIVLDFSSDVECYKIIKKQQDNVSKWCYAERSYKKTSSISLENKPICGLQLCNLNGNIAIHDPRGFYVPISSSRVGDFIEHMTIINGDIIGEYVYGWDNNKICVIPYGKEKLLGFGTPVLKEKIPVKKFELGKVYNDYKNNEYTYLGKMSILQTYSYMTAFSEKNNCNNKIDISELLFNTDIMMFDIPKFSVGATTDDIFLYNNKETVLRGAKKLYDGGYFNPQYKNIDENKKIINNGRYTINYKEITVVDKTYSKNTTFNKTSDQEFININDIDKNMIKDDQWIMVIDKENEKYMDEYDILTSSALFCRYKNLSLNDEYYIYDDNKFKMIKTENNISVPEYFIQCCSIGKTLITTSFII